MRGDILLDEVKSYLTRFCHFPSDAVADAATAFIAVTHAVDHDHLNVFETLPRFAILANGPASGKTTLLNLMIPLCHNGRSVVDPSAPAMVTLINEEKATLAIDEIDVFFGRGGGRQSARAMLNAGYKQGACVARQGKMMNCFAPVILAGMGQVYTTHPNLRPLYTRSICGWMAPKPEGKQVDEYRTRLHGSLSQKLHDSLAHWASRHARDAALAWPDMPDGITNRDRELWEPLIVMADLAGGRWPDAIRAAARHIVLSQVDEQEEAEIITPGQRMVNVVAEMFGELEALPTMTILERLAQLPEYRHLGQVAPRSAAMELAAALAPFGITSGKVWLADEQRSVQGYQRADVVKHATTLPTEEAGEEEVPLF